MQPAKVESALLRHSYVSKKRCWILSWGHAPTTIQGASIDYQINGISSRNYMFCRSPSSKSPSPVLLSLQSLTSSYATADGHRCWDVYDLAE